MKRASGGSSGGGGGRGSSGSSGGSSAGRSSGSSGSSGSGKSSSSSSGAGSAKAGTKGTISGGVAGGKQPKIKLGSQLQGTQRSQLFGSSDSYGRYGWDRPYAGGLPLNYGFWPLPWGYDVPANAAPNNDSRPGGPLLAAALQAPASNSTYVIYGDTQSVNALAPVLTQDCATVNASVPANLADNTTLQLYRDASFALYRFDGPQGAPNASLESCLNQTIGDNVLIAGAPYTA
ncbi:MAG: hypothetical protein INR71_14875, partial [Terriglobus roseus]|nr:hypothetical protein [Terriglobus roseus]